MLVFLVHVRDPQFYALPAKTRAKNGRIRVMGFPPIGIMSLSSVLKQAGHECVMFDQANPATPNEVIIEEINRRQPDLVGLSFLSTTSYPYAKILARQIRAANQKVKLAFGGVFATLSAQLGQAPVPRGGFRLPRRRGAIDPGPARAPGQSGVGGRADLGQGRAGPAQRQPDDGTQPGPMAVPGPGQPRAGFHRIHAAGCAGRALHGAVHHHADVARLSLALRVLRHPDLQRRQMAGPEPAARHGRIQAPPGTRLRVGLFRGRPFPPAAQAHRGHLQGGRRQRHHHPVGLRGARGLGGPALVPGHGQAHCRTIMFGIESGSQKILDRLQKEQTLAEVEQAVVNAKRAGLEIVHGFFTVGNPDETVEDMEATFDLASRLPLDTFGFNRLCVYRGTPLWQEYVKRGLVSDQTDWYKYFKCSTIDPTCLPGETINDLRQAGLRRLILYKFLHYPASTVRLLRRFLRYMPVRDVVYLLIKPFLGRGKGATRAEVLSRAVEHGAMKDAAASLTQVTDDMLEQVVRESRAERRRIQEEAEGRRELPMVAS